MVNGNARPQQTQAGRHFETIVFRALPQSGEDIAEARTERLPGAASQAEAWDKLYAALRHDRALIGGELREVH